MTIIFFHHITPRANIGNLRQKPIFDILPKSQYWKYHSQKPIFEISPKNGKFYPKMEKINSFFEGKSFNITNSQSRCLS